MYKKSKRQIFNDYLPTTVFHLCRNGALIVGSYAKCAAGKGTTFNDFDLIVPIDKWRTVSLLIPKDAKINNHGGWKFQDSEGNIIDIWPCSIEQHLKQCKPGLKGQEFILDYINNKIFTAFSIGTNETKKKQI